MSAVFEVNLDQILFTGMYLFIREGHCKLMNITNSNVNETDSSQRLISIQTCVLDMERTCKLHTERSCPSRELNPGPPHRATH